jgi:DNA polymerase IV
MDRQIVCLAIPSFEVALARLNDPLLRTRPLAIAPLNTSRALLREVSLEAVQDGLYVGMPIEQAKRLCPSLHVVSPNPHRVNRANQSLLSVVTRYAPVWEPFHAGSFVMDLTGTTKLFGSACGVAANAQQEILERFHLDGVAGVGSNKLVAQTAATLVEPSELYDVRHGSEGVFMSPLLVRTLPGLHRPCMRKILERLDDLNLLTLGDVAESPLDALSLAIGDYAGQLSRWAQGIDHAPVLHPAIQPSLEETVIMEPDEVDDPVLWGKLLDGLQRLCRKLRSQRRACRSLSLTIRYSDQVEMTKRERLTQETCWEVELSSHLYVLFQRCFRRRVRLRLMTLSMTGLTAYAEQVSLFDERPLDSQRKQERAKSLAVALDTLHDRFGEQAIRYGRSH